MKPRRQVLVVDHEPPAGPPDGGSLRMARLCEVMRASGHAVTRAAPGPALADVLRRDPGFDVVLLSRPACDGRRVHGPGAPDRAGRAARLRHRRPPLPARVPARQADRTPVLELARALARKREEIVLVRAADRTLVVSAAVATCWRASAPKRACTWCRASIRPSHHRDRSPAAAAPCSPGPSSTSRTRTPRAGYSTRSCRPCAGSCRCGSRSSAATRRPGSGRATARTG